MEPSRSKSQLSPIFISIASDQSSSSSPTAAIPNATTADAKTPVYAAIQPFVSAVPILLPLLNCPIRNVTDVTITEVPAEVKIFLSVGSKSAIQQWEDNIDSWLGNVTLRTEVTTHDVLVQRRPQSVPGGFVSKLINVAGSTNEKRPFEVGFVVARFHQRGFVETIKPTIEAMLQQVDHMILFVTGFEIPPETDARGKVVEPDAVSHRALFQEMRKRLKSSMWNRMLLVTCDTTISVVQQIVVANFLLQPKSVSSLWVGPEGPRSYWRTWIGAAIDLASYLEPEIREEPPKSRHSKSSEDSDDDAESGDSTSNVSDRRKMAPLESPATLKSVKSLCHFIITAAYHLSGVFRRPVNIGLLGPPNAGKTSLIRLWITALLYHGRPSLPPTLMTWQQGNDTLGTAFYLTPFLRIWDIQRWVDVSTEVTGNLACKKMKLRSLLKGKFKLIPHKNKNAWCTSSIQPIEEEGSDTEANMLDMLLIAFPMDWGISEDQTRLNLDLFDEISTIVRRYQQRREEKHQPSLCCAPLVTKMDLRASPFENSGSKILQRRVSKLRIALNGVAEKRLLMLQTWNPYCGDQHVRTKPNQGGENSEDVAWTSEQKEAALQALRTLAAVLYNLLPTDQKNVVEHLPIVSSSHLVRKIPLDALAPELAAQKTSLSLTGQLKGSVDPYADDTHDEVPTEVFLEVFTSPPPSAPISEDRPVDLWDAKLKRSIAIWRLSPHPFVLPPIGVAVAADSTHYVVTERTAEMISLSEALETPGWFENDSKRLRTLEGIAMVIYHLHRDELVHGQLNPKTIRVAQDGDPAISASHAVRITPDSENWRLVNVAVESTVYIAPELRSDKSAATTRAGDIWAFGCLLAAVLLDISDLKEPLPTPTELQKRLEGRAKLPKWLSQLYASCIAPDEMDRLSAPMLRLYFEFNMTTEQFLEQEDSVLERIYSSDGALTDWFPMDGSQSDEKSSSTLKRAPSWKSKPKFAIKAKKSDLNSSDESSAESSGTSGKKKSLDKKSKKSNSRGSWSSTSEDVEENSKPRRTDSKQQPSPAASVSSTTTVPSNDSVSSRSKSSGGLKNAKGK